MRADRLVSTLLLMQARGRVTAAELAKELEVSVATARRDLEALSTAGLPVYPQAGRGGGWQLLGGGRTDLSGLSSVEARALFLLVGPAASVAPDAKSALRKLVRALPDTFRPQAEAAAEAVVIDPARWGRPTRERPETVRILQDAVVRRVRIRLTYRAWDRPIVERTVDPWGLVEKDEVWYLLGGVDGAERTYRVDRITGVEITDQTAVRPHDFDLADAWNRTLGEVERTRKHASARIVIDTEVVPFLRERLGDEAVTDATGDEHYAEITASAPTETLLARSLAGWGEYLTVLEPESLREELRRIGVHLLQRNS